MIGIFRLMSVPQVVIVGRPNVGKSSIFNWLAGRRLAIVDDVPGITRDRVSQLVEQGNRFFELVDTGGIGIEDSDDLTDEIEHQIQIAIDTADLILFVVDSRTGLVPLDQEVTQRLRHINKPIICVANKTDHAGLDVQADEFYRLGHGDPLCVSTIQNRHRDELCELIVSQLPPPQDDDEKMTAPPDMKVAIVGRRNVGKSTFVNTLASAERMIVSKVPGTTRDSVDVRFELDGRAFVAIDTPGLTRTGSVKTDVDYYSMHRAKRSVRHADVVLLFFDASQRISKVDKQLCKYISEEYKPCIFVVNKWDLYHDKMPTEQWGDYIRDTFPMMWYAPIAFITGETGKNVKMLSNHAQMLFRQSRERIGTGALNRLVQRAIEKNPPPLYRHRRPKVFYTTQVATQPPTIVMVVNNPDGFSATYRRYLLGVFRDQLSFGEVPIKLFVNRRSGKDE